MYYCLYTYCMALSSFTRQITLRYRNKLIIIFNSWGCYWKWSILVYFSPCYCWNVISVSLLKENNVERDFQFFEKEYFEKYFIMLYLIWTFTLFCEHLNLVWHQTNIFVYSRTQFVTIFNMKCIKVTSNIPWIS